MQIQIMKRIISFLVLAYFIGLYLPQAAFNLFITLDPALLYSSSVVEMSIGAVVYAISAGMLALTLVAFSWLGEGTMEDYGFVRRGIFVHIGKGIVFGVLQPVAYAIILYFFFDQEKLFSDFANGKSLWILIAGLWLVLFSALAEEITFRTYFAVEIRRLCGCRLSAAIGGVVFGCAHIINDGYTFDAVIYTAIAGYVLSMLFYKTKSIWIATGFHAGLNYPTVVLWTSQHETAVPFFYTGNLCYTATQAVILVGTYLLFCKLCTCPERNPKSV